MIIAEKFPSEIQEFCRWATNLQDNDEAQIWAAWNYLNSAGSLLTATMDFRYDDPGDYHDKQSRLRTDLKFGEIASLLAGPEEFPEQEELNARYKKIYNNRLASIDFGSPDPSLETKAIVAPRCLPLLTWVISVSKKNKQDLLEAYDVVGILMSLLTSRIHRK